jgi:DNA-binding transcriptional LysR family regulator
VGANAPSHQCRIVQLDRAIMQVMRWDDLQVFLAAVRTGSQIKAGRALGVDPTTIGRRLAALERELGAKLFDRTPQRLVATAAGLAIVPRAERVEAELLAVQREAGGADQRVDGPIRITGGDGLLNAVVVPALVALRRRHPGLAIELRADTRRLDLSRREADLALRLVRPSQPSLIARRLGNLGFGVYASRGYLDLHPTPRTLADTAGHDWIGFEAELDDLPQVRWLRCIVPRPRWVIRANTTMTQVAACRAGHGLALLPTFVAEDLVQIAPRSHGPTRELWAVIHADLRRNARLAVVLDWLANLVGSSSARETLSGR